jgi:hypothetical protein
MVKPGAKLTYMVRTLGASATVSNDATINAAVHLEGEIQHNPEDEYHIKMG